MEKILYILISLWKAAMNLIYLFFKLFKARNKITFISRQTNNNNIDYDLIIKELETNKDIEIKVLNKRLEKNIFSVISYFFHMFVQMYHISTSKTVVLDGYCVMIGILKHKKDLKVIQIWHALGSLKKFAYSILDEADGTKSGMAKVMNMHKNYTYILTSSENSKENFRQAFNAKEEQMKVIPLPRVDFLKSDYYKNKTIEEFYDIYSESDRKKKKILYVPTFRKNTQERVEDLINNVDYTKYELIIKTHDGEEKLFLDREKIYSKKRNYTGVELLHIADYVISDYSAIVYETAVAQKPIYFYDYDYDEYMKNRGFYLNYSDEMPGPISKDIKEILNKITNEEFNIEKLKDFSKKYICDKYKNNTKKIVELINGEI